MRAAGVVLAGGRSSRMGAPKASLEWHGSTLLRRTCGVLRRAGLDPVVVVRAPGQTLPPLPADVEVVDDPREGLGPLQGMAVGLASVMDRADLAFVCSTDLPFLHAELVHRVLRPFSGPDGDELDVVLPVARGHPQPLAAVYRTRLASKVAALVAAERLHPAFVFEDAAVLRLDDAALLADAALNAADPELESVVNINEPADYEAARSRPEPQVTVECFGVLSSRAGREPRSVHAGTVGAAARAVDLTLDPHVLAAINGNLTSRDASLPLLPGDTVAFLPADWG